MGKFSLKNVNERKRIARSIVEPMLQGKRDHTVGSIYERIRPGKNGRIHTLLSPVGTSTFRLSSSESLLFEASTNMQNMANKIARLDPLYQVRDCITADPGKVLVAWDYSGAEAVLAAAYMRDWVWLDKLLGEADVHSEHAQAFFSISAADWAALKISDEVAYKFKRDIAKVITYSSLYRAQPRTIAERMNKDADSTGTYVTETEVAGHRGVLLQLHPFERWWQETAEDLAKGDGVLRNCFGYRRVFREPNPDYRLKDGLSFLPQSTVAWKMNECIVHLTTTLAPTLKKLSADLLLQIHDELLFQIPQASIPDLASHVIPLMTRPFTIAGRELHIPVEGKHGFTWGSMKKLKLAA